MKNNIGIYIHIPYCKSKCFYCDFYSQVEGNNIEEYINALCEEILLNSELLQNKIIDTVYFGGGTPSYIDAKYIVKIMDTLKLFTSNIKEATIEVNPESVTYDALLLYKACGINRISIGLQSINDNTLKKIGRKACFEDFKKAYDLVLKAGFTNISVDVICGLPNETIEDFKKTIDYLMTLKNLTHVSCYSLEVHENTKIDFLVKNNYITLPRDDIERKMKHLLDTSLEKAKFERYEISNYAKLGYKSIHNLKYWNQEEYFGFGVASASFLNSTRYSNISCIEKYILNIKNKISNIIQIDEMDDNDLMHEYVILRLRLKEGVKFNDFKNKFKKELYTTFKNEIDNLTKSGLLIMTDEGVFLSNKGEDLANLVWQEFI